MGESNRNWPKRRKNPPVWTSAEVKADPTPKPTHKPKPEPGPKLKPKPGFKQKLMFGVGGGERVLWVQKWARKRFVGKTIKKTRNLETISKSKKIQTENFLPCRFTKFFNQIAEIPNF